MHHSPEGKLWSELHQSDWEGALSNRHCLSNLVSISDIVEILPDFACELANIFILSILVQFLCLYSWLLDSLGFVVVVVKQVSWTLCSGYLSERPRITIWGKGRHANTENSLFMFSIENTIELSCPGGSDSRQICLQCRRPWFHPWVRKIPWRREWLPTPVFLPEKFHGQRSLVGYSSCGRKSQIQLSSQHFHFDYRTIQSVAGQMYRCWATMDIEGQL